MSIAYVVSRSLLVGGVAVIVVSSIGAVLVDDFYRRLHYLTPVSSLGLPLVGLALAVTDGWSLTSAQVLLTVFLVAMAGPVLTSATARMAAQRDNLIDQDSPQ